MIPAMYDLVFGTLPSQEKHREVLFIVHAHAMPIPYSFLGNRHTVALLPAVDAVFQSQEVQMIVHLELDVHQYCRGEIFWLST